MTDVDYLRQQLEWVTQRIKALDEIDIMLIEMKALTVYARDHNLNRAELQEVNDKLSALQKIVNELDERSKVFWVGCQ